MTRPLSTAVAARLTAVAIGFALVEVIRRRVVLVKASRRELASRAAAREVATHG